MANAGGYYAGHKYTLNVKGFKGTIDLLNYNGYNTDNVYYDGKLVDGVTADYSVEKNYHCYIPIDGTGEILSWSCGVYVEWPKAITFIPE